MKLAERTLWNKVRPKSTIKILRFCSPVLTESVASLTASLFNEQKGRERRELNLIVHNMLESTASEGAGRKKDDIMKVTYLGNEG